MSSLCTGSYISKAFGTSGFGKLNNFKFPFPVTLTIKSRLSPFFKLFLEGVTLKSNFPTAPLKLSGLPVSGSGFTFIVLLPAETRLLVSVSNIRPNISLRLEGN